MRTMTIVLGSLGALAAVVGIGQIAASESGEVLVLQSQDESGEWQETRIWVVDDAGSEWVRGRPSSGWVGRLIANQEVSRQRGGAELSVRAVPDRNPEKKDRINALMRQKYGFSDRFIAVTLGDPNRAEVLPIRLDPR